MCAINKINHLNQSLLIGDHWTDLFLDRLGLTGVRTPPLVNNRI
jgi:hypothetical protein